MAADVAQRGASARRPAHSPPSAGHAPAGRLILCPTPIGNLDDITLRAITALREADVVFAEDTRRTRVLLAHLGIAAQVRSCHDHNEAVRAQEAVDRIAAGQQVVLVTDAGTPGLADPGYRVLQAVVGANLPATALPGPSALLPALTLSGLPTAGFCFLGFLPRRPGQRARALTAGLRLPYTVAVYESPHRILATLNAAADLAPERPAAIARELTKLHEEVIRGTLRELAARWTEPPRGEIILLWGPAQPGAAPEGGRRGRGIIS